MNGERSTMERQKDFIVKVLYWALIAGGILLGYKYTLPVMFPFVIAFLVSWVINRPVTYLKKNWKIPRGVSGAVFAAVFICSAICIFALCGAGILSGIENLLSGLPKMFDRDVIPALESFFSWMEQMAETIDPEMGAAFSGMTDTLFSHLSNGVLQLCGTLLGILGGVVYGIPSAFMKIMITLIATIFITIDFEKVKRFLTGFIPVRNKDMFCEFKEFFGKIVPRCLLSYGLIFLITFGELFLGFSFLRIENSFGAALLVAVLDILPVLGTGAVLIPWAIIALLQGNTAFGVIMAVLYLLITIVRNIIEPRLVGRQMKLHPALTFAAMLVGLRIFGVIGLFGLPLCFAFLGRLHEKGIINIPALNKE